MGTDENMMPVAAMQMDDAITCPPHVDSFLAYAETKPLIPLHEKPRMTAEERERLIQELDEFIDKKMPKGFWD